MTVHQALDPRPQDPAMGGIIKLALLAVVHSFPNSLYFLLKKIFFSVHFK